MAPRSVLLMVRELGLGGSERQAAEIARALDRSRFEPVVGCFRPHGFRAEELRSAGVPVLEFPVRSFASASAISGAAALGRCVRRYGIRLAHAFDSPMNLFGVPAARAFGVPRVLSSQRAHRELTPRVARHLLRLTDQMVDAVVVNCLSVGRQLMSEEKVPSARIRVCYNGLDTAAFQAVRGPRPGPLQGAELVAGVVCALRPEKNLRLLIHAFAAIAGDAPGMKLAVVGSGPERDSLMTLARDCGVGGCVHFEPATPHVAEWLRGIDIFVLPSKSEALSNSLMEAMASGCACVATRVGGNPELIEHERSGLLFGSGDADGLGRWLRLLAADAELRNRLADAGAARIREEFSIEASARRMGEIYDSLLEG